ncbi:hypothetical protein GCM10011374_33090 [Kocuria dechangensis]|uniref:Short subunit dehydrogenase n=1 Tax=Kocuria dechangensis TaxID=1176249 RepID=A0A917H3H1_9MICC|nr:hypothetical protein GCM10011374_33090 [Kocuria dechangensis]
MTEQNTTQTAQQQMWFITGAGRGMGTDIARAALADGHSVVGTARDAARVTAALGEHENLLALSLDITDPAAAQAAVESAVDRFGRLDVLVNNAGNFYAGFFEEISPADVRADEHHARGASRHARPALRAGGRYLLDRRDRRAGVLHCVRGLEVRGRGVDRVPGPGGRTLRHHHDAGGARLLPHRPAHPGVDHLRRALHCRLRRSHPPDRHGLDLDERPAGRRPGQARRRPGRLTGLEQPPARWVAGANAVEAVEQKARDLLAQVDAHRELSSSLAVDRS